MVAPFPLPVPASAPVAPVAHRMEVLARLSADASVLKAMGLARCAVFGSFARDLAIRPDTDVDLLVSFQGLSRHLATSVLGEALDVALSA
jgi:predicted nucleotidyltransferase